MTVLDVQRVLTGQSKAIAPLLDAVKAAQALCRRPQRRMGGMLDG